MRKQTLLFDLDDTLIHCNKYFVHVIKQFAEQMRIWFSAHALSKSQFIAKQLELDIIGVRKYGFVPFRFPESLVETYDHFCSQTGRRKKEEERHHLLELGYTVYDFPNEPYPHMNETLEELASEGHQLCLYTGGDPEMQRAKVSRLELDAYFGERIYVTRHKTVTAMRDLVSELALKHKETWMIGNSVTTDIIPALTAGIHAIFIPAETEWTFNKGEVNVSPQGEYVKLEALHEVPGAIRQYADAASSAGTIIADMHG